MVLQFPKTRQNNTIHCDYQLFELTQQQTRCHDSMYPTPLSWAASYCYHWSHMRCHLLHMSQYELASQWANCLISAMRLKLGLQFIDCKPTTVKPCLLLWVSEWIRLWFSSPSSKELQWEVKKHSALRLIIFLYGLASDHSQLYKQLDNDSLQLKFKIGSYL